MKDYSVILYCSNCQEALVDIWVTIPGPPLRVRAKCPHCGDASFWKEIHGKFAMGETEKTTIGPTEYTGESLEISCRKK